MLSLRIVDCSGLSIPIGDSAPAIPAGITYNLRTQIDIKPACRLIDAIDIYTGQRAIWIVAIRRCIDAPVSPSSRDHSAINKVREAENTAIGQGLLRNTG